MATKTPNTTPNEPNRPPASRAKAKPKTTTTKAEAADSKSKTKPKSSAAARPKSAPAKAAAKADSAAKPKAAKPAKATAPKTVRARSDATKPSTKKKKAAAPVGPSEATPFENHVVKTLFDLLEAHVAANELGHVVGPKEFELGESEPTGRLPDIAFVSFERWAPYRRVPSHDRWHVAPDLLVHVVRKGEPAEDFTTQLDECFNAGVRRVWLVFPDKGEAQVYESASDVKTLGEKQHLEGGDVLPGFEQLLGLLFQEPKDPS